MTVEHRTTPSAAEPLFTSARTSNAGPGPGAIAADPWAPRDEERPAVRLSLVETVMDRMGGPVIELGAAPVAFIPPPLPTTGPRHRRKGMVRNFREWWRQESLARAAQKEAQDRVQNELSAISRSLREMHDQISELIALKGPADEGRRPGR